MPHCADVGPGAPFTPPPALPLADKPYKEFSLTFLFMAFIAFIFASVGLYAFGNEYSTYDDVWSGETAHLAAGLGAPDRVRPAHCPNLMICFFETIEMGIRSGDIVDAAFDTVSCKTVPRAVHRAPRRVVRPRARCLFTGRR